MEFITWGLIIATVFFILYLRSQSRKPKILNGKVLRSLPGPKGLPLIGNLLQLTASPNKQYTKWSQEFGDIFELKLAGQCIVIVNNPKLAKEIFSDPGVLGRPHMPPSTEWYPDTPNIGIIMSEGELWEVHRRFLLRQLRDFGFGKSSMETLIMEDVNEVIVRFKKQSRNGQPIGNINHALKIAVVNSLWQLLTNQKFDHDDPQLSDFLKRISEVLVDMLERGALFMIFPSIRHILPEISGFNNWVRV